MKLRDILNEALVPSEFRSLMAVGRETALSRINQIWSRLKSQAIKSDNPKDRRNRHLDSKDRLYFNINSNDASDISNTSSKDNIIKYLNEKGYNIVDYVQGLVNKKGDDRIIKLGKVLTMLGKDDGRGLNFLQKYNNEKSVQVTGSDYILVISKHPYDIGGMATDRSWTSCMDLRGGEYSKFVEVDIEEGTMVSYLLDKNDVNINKPIARISIKPYINIGDENDVLYGIESESVKYGRQHEGYVKTLVKILDIAQKEKTGIFDRSDNLYTDSDKKTISKINQSQLELLAKKIKSSVLRFEDGLTFDVIVSKYPWLLFADFEDAVIGYDISRIKISWRGGTWKRGRWVNGTWENGVWKNGTWVEGYWLNGTWENGTWLTGDWVNGTWQNGIWRGGYWQSGEWQNGEWKNGEWKNGTWKDGTWKTGVHWNGSWYEGVWEAGSWRGGDWEGGIWKDGNWYNGLWKNGIWQDGTWNDGTWQNGTWLDGVWWNGTWEGGIWKGGKWLSNKSPKPSS
jgi:hypothetical protein